MTGKADAKRNRFRQKIFHYMRDKSMTERGDRVLAAVSGGADSVCLLLLLHELAVELGITVFAFHMNHGIRGAEADRDEQFVENLCKRLDIPLTTVHERVEEYAAEQGLSSEEAGRILRYRHLEETAEKYQCTKIAVAHHEDDDVETVLLNLFRGSGLAGLAGIRPMRGKIIRPLLCVGRREIEEFLDAAQISWCEDSTNKENEYTRNKIRNVLVPWLTKEINHSVGEHVLAVSEFAASADEYFRVQAEKFLQENGGTGITVKIFDAQPEILKSYIIRGMIVNAAGKSKNITERHIRSVMELSGPGGGHAVDLPYGLRAVRGYETLEITHVQTEEQEPGLPELRFHTIRRKKELEIPKNQYTKWFDYDKINVGLSIRYRKNGDYFTLPGGGKKKLGRFMIDEKIPEKERDRIPLLVDGNHVLWVIGYRISDYYKITDETEHILEAEVILPDEEERPKDDGEKAGI